MKLRSNPEITGENGLRKAVRIVLAAGAMILMPADNLAEVTPEKPKSFDHLFEGIHILPAGSAKEVEDDESDDDDLPIPDCPPDACRFG